MPRPPNVRWKRVLGLGVLAGVLSVAALVGVVYASTDIPEPNPDATATATRVLYADGTEMGRVGARNRIPVDLDAVPDHVQQAVLAAEDRRFYTEPGISPRGIARALLTNVRGGGVQQGGSTITQQYAKNAFLTQERTYTRKVKEAFIALKMSRTREKDSILEDYLNTIYWGREASGLRVAARAYFGTDDVSKLTVAQGAVLAATIRSPATLDPSKHPERARARWGYVLDGMVDQGWLSAQERAAQVYPKVLGPGEGPRNNDLSGPKGHVIAQVLGELSRRGVDEAELASGAFAVLTTIRRSAQEAAVAAVQEVTGPEPGQDDLQGALVSVEPATGAVWAYYGGATGTGFDFASNDGIGRQPGSSFKPYVLAAALEQGVSLRTRLDGDDDREFPGAPRPVQNFGGASYGPVDLVEATQKSVNTAYFQLGLEVGPARVAELAHAAGIPQARRLANEDGTVEGGIALGRYEVQVIDQAVGYATFANGGVPVEPFLVQRVTRGDEVVLETQVQSGPAAFSEDTAADATYAMEQVVERGTGQAAELDGGREAAGKTGTSSDNKDAWFVGFTPQLSTAVWLGYAAPRTITLDGVEVTGGGFASRIWKGYMEPALSGMPEVDLPDPVFAGRRARASASRRSRPCGRGARDRSRPRSSRPSLRRRAPLRRRRPRRRLRPRPRRRPRRSRRRSPSRTRRRTGPGRRRASRTRRPSSAGRGGAATGRPGRRRHAATVLGPEQPAGAAARWARMPSVDAPLPVVLPSSEDPLAAGAASALGGPPGQYSRTGPRRFWTPVRWLVLLTLLTCLLGWWQKSPCREHAWAEQYQYTRGCYTDVYALYFSERLDDGRTPYAEHPVEYPVVLGGVMHVAAEVVAVVPAGSRPAAFYDVTWALLTACALVVVVTTARLAGRRRPWDAALFAVAPLLALHGSTNWDLVAMALAGLGLVQWARSRPLAAGVLLGLATATKLYPLLFLVPLAALCRRAGRQRAWAVTAAAAVLTPVLVSLPVYLTSPSFADVGGTQTVVAASPLDRLAEDGLGALRPTVPATAPDGTPVIGVNAAYRFVHLNTTRPADWDSLWYLLQTARGGVPLDTGPGAPHTLNRAVAATLLAALAGVVLLALRAPRRPRAMQLLFLTVLAFLLTNKVWSPQFSLWLVPLAALARPRWGPILAWQAAEALVLLTRFYFFVAQGAPGKGIGVGWFLSAVALRDVLLVVLAALVVRDVLRPELDVVRRDGVDDPAGGVLDRAPDRRRAPAGTTAPSAPG